MMDDSIFIIGHPDSGKSSFIAQFLLRIKKRKSEITLTKAPKDISAINSVVKQLSRGEAPSATSATESAELILPITVEDENINLICSDYGGEQVSNITELMEVEKSWVKRLNDCDKWILFIRAGEISPEYDLSISSFETVISEKEDELQSSGLSQQSKFIELLQSILFVKSIGVTNFIKTPTLTIVLTCWDELSLNGTPVEILQRKLPLLLHFIKTVWDEKAYSIIGLSSLEFPLGDEEAKNKYRDELPENFGYIIDCKGKKDKDLTKLIKKAIEL